ncbi:UDP-glucuronosyltransferase 2C1-like [Melanotaenia boesemani]|uniref:UDP-glucuronosyltransferase 2C1-like n=1 Tax=Melanotaenia boesemani TaxID=1250792 RepID=UPI001C049036|nr:UDP-glucuronosyltransferase 2C1-like [Melanotaenia boesemani]
MQRERSAGWNVLEMCRPALVTLAALLCLSTCVNGGKVLVFPVDGSHWINMKVIIEELDAGGHEVTVLRPSDSWYIKPDSPHYTAITINSPVGFDKEQFGSYITRTLKMRRQGSSFWNRMSLEYDLMYQFHEMHKQMLQMMEDMFENSKLMQSLRDAKYDLVLTDPAIGGGVLLAHRLGLPLVFNVRWTVQGEGHQAIAPSPLSYVPLPGSELTDKMTFNQRIKNLLFHFFGRLQMWYITDSNYKPFVHRHFGSHVHYMELFQAADIWLMRNDFTFEFPRPTMPNVVYMSGFQCKPSKPLPKELDDFVQSSGEHGVIVMTLGTLVEKLPEDIAEDIAAAFAQLPQKVIWRHKGKRPSTLGNNTLILDWLPQNDLLGHPKTKVFVAHGGTNGMQEAIYHGVPLVGLPLMFDQPDNFFRMEARGVAKVLDIATINKDIFLGALKEVLYEPSYREKMQELSRLHRDQPMKPLDRAMFWIKFVMRHKGAAHLRTESYKMSMIQYYSIDVVAFLLAVTLTVFAVFIYVVKLLWQKVFYRNKVKKE